MKRALVILSVLGLLCAVISVIYLALPPRVSQQLPNQQAISMAELVILVALPILGFVDAILGAIVASQRHAPRWSTAFIVLAVITLPMYGCGFILSILDAFPGNRGIGYIASGLLYFSVVIFLAALVFAPRQLAQPVASPASVSHAIDSRPPRE